jgi:hypothetical protein
MITNSVYLGAGLVCVVTRLRAEKPRTIGSIPA